MTKVLIKELGFKRSSADHSVFYRHTADEHTIMAVAMDDMAVTSKRGTDIQRFKTEIKKHWEMNNNGPINWFLGFQIKRDRNSRTISINQHAYIENMLEKFRLTSAKPVTTPMEPNTQFSIEQSPSTHKQVSQMQGVPYREAIRCILWLAVVSRLDITFAVGILSQFVQNPGPVHWEAVKRVIVYLGTTKNLWLTFGGKSETIVEGYCNADWASQKHRHLILGYSFHFGQGVISWSSKKQNIIALSSTKAEYIAQTHAAKEAMWMKKFLDEIHEPIEGLIRVNCDNQGVIALVKDRKISLAYKVYRSTLSLC